MRVLVVSANLGNFDTRIGHVRQIAYGDDEIDYHCFTDDDFPPRINSMTSRLQARIPKMTAWQMMPDYDYYLWIDASCRLNDPKAVQWFMEQLGVADIAVLKHPHRNTVGEEADYLRERLLLESQGEKQEYLLPRYGGERLEAQMAVINEDYPLYASTVFIYKNDTPARDLLSIWWMHISLYHSIDQLSLPAAIERSGAKVNVIDENYLKIPWIEYVRNQ